MYSFPQSTQVSVPYCVSLTSFTDDILVVMGCEIETLLSRRVTQ